MTTPGGRLHSLPTVAAWRHLGARDGYEVVFFDVGAGVVIEGTSVGTEDGASWWVHHRLELDLAWTTRRAVVTGRSVQGSRQRTLESDGRGRWTVDGVPDPRFDGCVDLDLEASVVTNTVPVHRIDLQRDERADAPAVFLRAADLAVERLDQRYALAADRTSGLGGAEPWAMSYEAPRFGLRVDLTLDGQGLVLDYPGLARRTA